MFCPNCGAPVKKSVCDYCGAVVTPSPAPTQNNPQSVKSTNTQTSTTTNTTIKVIHYYNTPAPNTRTANTPANTPTAAAPVAPVRKGTPKNKWLAFILCLVFGFWGVHKFYEGKVGMGFLYLFTAGLFGIGWFIDTLVLLCQPTTYYV